ncbi:hypothetical protein PG993_002728 [Apiospora rasikravindrae]|uniref:C2H2-type domain-containing protein n=1 Tax=Apiospora rasikravindrae TaxID=990691 RepID=A0ABR1TXH6_9PEZI
MALGPQAFQNWPCAQGDTVANIASGAAMVMATHLEPNFSPAGVVGGRTGNGPSAGVFGRQRKPLIVQTEPCLQSATQTALSMSFEGVTAGAGSIHIYNNENETGTAHPTSAGSYCDSPSDQSSQNENGRTKRKRSEDKEKSSQDRKPSSSGFIGYTCRIDGCNKEFASKKEVERHQYESLAHEQTYKPKYSCEERRCKKYKEPFTRKDNLRRHIKDMHGDKLP